MARLPWAPAPQARTHRRPARARAASRPRARPAAPRPGPATGVIDPPWRHTAYGWEGVGPHGGSYLGQQLAAVELLPTHHPSKEELGERPSLRFYIRIDDPRTCADSCGVAPTAAAPPPPPPPLPSGGGGATATTPPRPARVPPMEPRRCCSATRCRSRGRFRLRLTYVTPVPITKLRMDTPGRAGGHRHDDD
eukprot:COSAG01_NODE_1911_length_8925_cov_151.747111_15_plen_193_part_00